MKFVVIIGDIIKKSINPLNVNKKAVMNALNDEVDSSESLYTKNDTAETEGIAGGAPSLKDYQSPTKQLQQSNTPQLFNKYIPPLLKIAIILYDFACNCNNSRKINKEEQDQLLSFHLSNLLEMSKNISKNNM